MAKRGARGFASNYTNSQISEIIDEVIHSKRDRQIMKDRLIDGICYEPLAEKYDLSVAQVKRIIYKYSDIIFCSDSFVSFLERSLTDE